MSNFLKSVQSSCLVLCALSAFTLEGTWSQSNLVSSKSSELSIDIDGSGNAMAVWNGSIETTANNVFYNYIGKGALWHASLMLSDTDGRAIMSVPQIAIDENSNVVAVWEEFDYENRITTVNARTLSSPGKWSPIIELSKSVGAGRSPKVAINSSGYAVVAWRNWDQGNSPRAIQAATFQFGGSWSAAVNIGIGENVQVAVDNAGNAIAVWNDSNIDSSIIKSATLPKGGTWSSPATLSNRNHAGIHSLGINESGYAVAIWEEMNSDGAEPFLSVKASSKQPGGSWSESQEIFIPDVMFQISSLKVVVDASGIATAVWGLGVLDHTMPFPVVVDNSIQAARLPLNGKWSKPRRISSKNLNVRGVDIGIDDKGNAIAVWSTQDGVIQGAIRPLEGPWSAPSDVSLEGGKTTPRIAVDNTGYGVVVWEADFGGIQSAIWTP